MWHLVNASSKFLFYLFSPKIFSYEMVSFPITLNWNYIFTTVYQIRYFSLTIFFVVTCNIFWLWSKKRIMFAILRFVTKYTWNESSVTIKLLSKLDKKVIIKRSKVPSFWSLCIKNNLCVESDCQGSPIYLYLIS